MNEAEYKGHRFTDKDVVDPDRDWIWAGSYNPNKVRPWLIYNEYGTLAVVFASHESDALDAAVDAGKMESCRVPNEDVDAMSEEEQEELAFLGNAGEPHDLTYVGVVELPNPAFSFVVLFNAHQRAARLKDLAKKVGIREDAPDYMIEDAARDAGLL
jgi:hypothetical protein